MDRQSLETTSKPAKTEQQAKMDIKRLLCDYYEDEGSVQDMEEPSKPSDSVNADSQLYVEAGIPAEVATPTFKTPNLAGNSTSDGPPGSRRSSRISPKSLKAREADEVTDPTTPTRRGRTRQASRLLSDSSISSTANNKESAEIAVKATSADENSADEASVDRSSPSEPSSSPHTTATKPSDATLDHPWHCANPSCTTGQTWKPRDGAGGFGRKVISNFFGRNKKATNSIHNDVWHNYCRKCYQRKTYSVTKLSAQAKCAYYLDNIRMQIDRLELWRPEATFTVRLSKGALDRLHEYWKECRKAGGDEGAAARAVTKGPQSNAHGKPKPLTLEEAFPARLMDAFNANFCDEVARGYGGVREILDWTGERIATGETEVMPPMEFLMSELQRGERVNDPTENFERWEEMEKAKAAKVDGKSRGKGKAIAGIQHSDNKSITKPTNNPTVKGKTVAGIQDSCNKWRTPLVDEPTTRNPHTPPPPSSPILKKTKPKIKINATRPSTTIHPSIETSPPPRTPSPPPLVRNKSNDQEDSDNEATISGPSEPGSPSPAPRPKRRFHLTNPNAKEWAPSSSYPGAFTTYSGDGKRKLSAAFETEGSEEERPAKVARGM